MTTPNTIAKVNQGYAYREQVQLPGAGATEHVLDYLVRRHRHSDAETWRRRLLNGEVEVDSVPAGPETTVHSGQLLVWHRPPWAEPVCMSAFSIVFEDDALLAVAKPRGLPTMPGGGFLEQTLLTQVQARHPGAIPMHRLGRETSGLVLFALTHPVAAILQKAWRGHEVRKWYRALGSGRAKLDHFEVTTPIGPVPHPRLGTVHAACAAGKPARSIVEVLERRADSTLFWVEIKTGRPHQIRIHLAAAGHPLVGDPLYVTGGTPRPDNAGLPGDGGYFLHAEQLSFVHPLTGKPTTLQTSGSSLNI